MMNTAGTDSLPVERKPMFEKQLAHKKGKHG